MAISTSTLQMALWNARCSLATCGSDAGGSCPCNNCAAITSADAHHSWDADRCNPISSTAIPLFRSIKGARLVVVDGAPHGLIWTHAEKVNQELVDFLR